MVPKILHYVWVGSEIPVRVRALIENNRTHAPDYEIKVWTEKNLPTLNKFAAEALKRKKWAFVSDYVRFVVLYEMGGIYLDTDQKLVKNIDGLLDFTFFSGWNPAKSFIFTGIVGCKPRLDFINEIVLKYDDLEYDVQCTSPKIITECYNNYPMKEDLKVFDSTYFYPVAAGESSKGKILEHTYATHLWDESWRSFVPLRRFLRRIGIMRVYHFIFK